MPNHKPIIGYELNLRLSDLTSAAGAEEVLSSLYHCLINLACESNVLGDETMELVYLRQAKLIKQIIPAVTEANFIAIEEDEVARG